MKRRLIGLALVLLVAPVPALLDAGPAGACSCRSFTDADAFGYADAVFVGTVADYDAPEQPTSSVDPARWTFAVRKVLKGGVARRQTVVSEVSGVSCGLEIPRSGEFVVFATRRGSGIGPDPAPGELYAGLCGGTRAAASPLPAGLGRSRPPEPGVAVATGESGGWPPSLPVWVGGAFVVAALGTGIVLVARRSRS